MTRLRSSGASAGQASPPASRRSAKRVGRKTAGQAVATALAAWGDPLPDWIDHLAREVDATSTARAARRVKYSAPVVSSILRRSYLGDEGAVEQAVRGALMNYRVQCPVLGEIGAAQCSTFQRKKLNTANPTNVTLWRACRRGCPNSRLKDERKSP